MLEIGDVIVIALCSSLLTLLMAACFYWLLLKPGVEQVLDNKIEAATDRVEQFIRSELAGNTPDLSPEALRGKAILAAKTGAGLMEGGINKVINTLGARARSTVESSSGGDE